MKIESLTSIILTFLFVSGCGVKGDPLPPEKPPHLGRGRPTYQRAAEEFAYPNLPPVQQIEEEEENPQDEESVEQ